MIYAFITTVVIMGVVIYILLWQLVDERDKARQREDRLVHRLMAFVDKDAVILTESLERGGSEGSVSYVDEDREVELQRTS